MRRLGFDVGINEAAGLHLDAAATRSARMCGQELTLGRLVLLLLPLA